MYLRYFTSALGRRSTAGMGVAVGTGTGVAVAPAAAAPAGHSPDSIVSVGAISWSKGIAGPGGAVYDVTFDSRGRRAAAVTFGGRLRMWDVSTDETIHDSNEAGKLFLTTFSPNGRLLVCAGFGVFQVDAESGEPVRLGQVRGGATSLVFSPDGARVIATGRGTRRLDAPAKSHLQVWDVASHKETLTRDIPGLVLAASAPGGVRLAVFTGDGATNRDLDSEAELFRFAGARVQELFEYVPGRSPEEEPPLVIFREKELPWIGQ